jgi:hypothetical protein
MLSADRKELNATVESLCERLMLLPLEAEGVERVPFVRFWPRGARRHMTLKPKQEGTSVRR